MPTNTTDLPRPVLGALPMPADFRYRDVLRTGRPRHEKWDDFSLRHPPMDPARWAKIFNPFDALDGFDEAIASKEVVYEQRKHLDEEAQRELNRRLTLLRARTRNLRMARANPVVVTVTFFEPCADRRHSAFRAAGRYRTVTGRVLKVERDRLILERSAQAVNEKLDIALRELLSLTQDAGLFDADAGSGSP